MENLVFVKFFVELLCFLSAVKVCSHVPKLFCMREQNVSGYGSVTHLSPGHIELLRQH